MPARNTFLLLRK